MALLNFKMGNWSDKFDSIPITPGTVYITKNEGGMYVDTDDNKRVRIAGNIIQVESARTAKPPFSTDVIYYFIEENALLRYDGVNWVQLNSTSDIEKDITNLTAQVSTNASAISSLQQSVTNLEAKDVSLNDAIIANQEAIAANDTELADLTTRMGAVETKANSTATDLTNLTSTVNTMNSTVVSQGNSIADLTPRVKDLEDKVGNDSDSNTILGRLKNNEAAIQNNTNAIGTDTTTDTIKYRIKQLENLTSNQSSTLTTHEDAITALQEAVGTSGEGNSLASRMAAVEAKNDEQDTAISAAQTQADKGVTDAAAAQKTANTANTTANTNASRLTVIEGTGDGSIAKAVADEASERSAADSALSNSISANTTNIATNKSNIEKNATDISTNKTNIATNTAAIATLNGDKTTTGSVDQKIEAAKAALSAEIDADINAANAMNYIKNITKYSELPSIVDNVHIGDTYVVGTAFNNNDIQYNAGDMLIAGGVEDANGNIIDSISWNHVKTGYDVTNEPSLIGVDNSIKLLSHLATNLGEITFADGGSGIKANIQANTVTLSMEWGTFGDE